MASRITMKKLLGIILLVIMLAIIIMVYVMPTYGIYDKIKEKTSFLSSPDIDESSTNYFPGLYITETDTELDKIRKIFGSFDPNYAHCSSEPFEWGDSYDHIVKFEKITLENSDERIEYSDVVSTINDAMEQWALKHPLYDIICPNGIELKLYDYLAWHDCWDEDFLTLKYHVDRDGNFNQEFGENICKVHIGRISGQGTDLYGEKTIRVMWYLRKFEDKEYYELYPLITICNAY